MEKKSKLIPILIGIIVLLIIVIGVLILFFGDAIWNQERGKKEEETTTETKKEIDWKTEYYNKLKELENEKEEIAYAFIYVDDNDTPILVVGTTDDNDDTYLTYDFYMAYSKIEKIGSDNFNTKNQIDAITKKGKEYYLMSLKADAKGTNIESITINDIKIKKGKIVFEEKESLDIEGHEEDLSSIIKEKYGDFIELKEIEDYEYLDEVKKSNDSNIIEVNEVKEKKDVLNVIEYNKKYLADGTGDFDDGIYFIFYKDGTLEYSENMCEGFFHLKGTYKIEEERIIVNIPEALNGNGKWALKIISKDKLKFDESYKTFDYVCGFAKGFVLEK